MFCQGIEEKDEDHSRRECPVFRELKGKTSFESYIAVELKPCDAAGYAAAENCLGGSRNAMG